jgi:hypothetical protein
MAQRPPASWQWPDSGGISPDAVQTGPARYIAGMEALYVLLIFAAAIAIIYLGGSWNTSDVDHYMGFDNLRSPSKPKVADDDKDAETE